MNKSISRIIGVIMLIVAFVFIMFALNHPEKSFPWNNTITWLLYGVYFLVAVVLLIAPKMKKPFTNMTGNGYMEHLNRVSIRLLLVLATMLIYMHISY